MSAVKVKMLVGLSGPALTLNPGDEHEFAAYEANRLVEAGFAELVETEAERQERLKAEAKAANEAAEARAAELKKAEEEAAAKAQAEAEAKAKADAEAAEQGAGGASSDESKNDAPAAPQFADLKSARDAYKAAFGKGPGIQWDVATIAAKIAAKPAEG